MMEVSFEDGGTDKKVVDSGGIVDKLDKGC